MTSGANRTKVELNPELEALRNKGLRENFVENNEWILQMIYKTSRIHAGYLFEDRKTLQNLCLFISETQNKITDAGWEAFGYHLGLNPSVLKVINYNNFNKEDPCYNVLLAYVQHENASIGKIIEALNSMGRIDVLSRMKTSINNLANIILQCNLSNDNSNSNNLIEETSDYESLISNEGPTNSNRSSRSNIDSSCENLIKPQVLPSAPLVFQNIQGTPEFLSQQFQKSSNPIVFNSVSNFKREDSRSSQIFNEKVICIKNFNESQKIKLVENLQNQSICNHNENKFQTSIKQKYGIKILLTFAEDGENYAIEVSKIFRKKRENYPKIGVLILSEHAAVVNKDPQQFISGSFSQVDYICPILTKGYFDLISKKQKAYSLSNVHIDAAYAPYIFRLMNSYFISNDCLNDKVRSIIPDSEFTSVPFKNLWVNPIFGAWVRLDEVEDLAMRLLKNKTKV